MSDFLVDHAIRNVWCAPGQDLQSIVKPARISPRLGIWNSIKTGRRTVKLPTPQDRYHVFRVGQIYPLLLNWLPITQRWVPFSEASNTVNLFIDLYINSGLKFPVTESYFYITEDRDVLVAIKEQARNPASLRFNDLYFRGYTNAFYNSSRADAGTEYVKVDGRRITNNNELLALQNRYNSWMQLPGHTFAYVNGFLVSGIDMFTTQVGDYAEIVYDGSVYRVLDIPLPELPVFTSTLDAKQKYLVHYAGLGTGNIDFQDDIEVYLTKANTNGRWQGVYYHRNQEDAVRMLTHKDYSLTVPYVAAYANDQDWLLSEIVVRVYLRKSGFERPLVNETNRIRELYKANDADVVRAMTGVDSAVPSWQAPVLEAAKYPAVMRVDSSQVTNALVQQAYGYNAITKLIGDTPSPVYTQSNQKMVDVPFGLQSACIGYEFDADGLLLGYYQHYAGTYYAVRNPSAVWVELVAGFLKDRLYEGYGLSEQPLDPAVDYRFYTCPIVAGTETNVWTDVTGSYKYSIVNNRVYWNIDHSAEYTMSRGNLYVLGYSLDLPMDEGLLRFSLTSKQKRHGEIHDTVMQVPAGELTVFLNRHPLIEGVDYIVHFPQVMIISKEYLVNPDTDLQHIVIRHSGLCRSDLTMEPVPDKGFIVKGLLSKNNRFDLRDDAVLQIFVGGAFYDRSELKFAENDPAVSVPDAKNGMPYQIRDIVVPVGNFTEGDTYALRAASRAIDKQISNYLTLKLPEQPSTGPNVITGLYKTFSPFCAKILFDMLKGDLTDPRLQGHYGDSVVFELCHPYEFILPYDPTQDANLPDSDYVVIEPHHLNYVVTVDIYTYKFLSRVVRLYLKNRVELSDFLVMSA